MFNNYAQDKVLETSQCCKVYKRRFLCSTRWLVLHEGCQVVLRFKVKNEIMWCWTLDKSLWLRLTGWKVTVTLTEHPRRPGSRNMPTGNSSCLLPQNRESEKHVVWKQNLLWICCYNTMDCLNDQICPFVVIYRHLGETLSFGTACSKKHQLWFR